MHIYLTKMSTQKRKIHLITIKASNYNNSVKTKKLNNNS